MARSTTTTTGGKTSKSKNAPADKKSKDKVAKRPARGYHKFRNGLLNVTPKGGEKELVKANQQSPLLRLPAEIRTMIWNFALGGMVYRPREISARSFCLRSSINVSKGISLLRVCRQIYAEAAEIPLRESIFSFERLEDDIKKTLNNLKRHQRKLITKLQIEISEDDALTSWGAFRALVYLAGREGQSYLPGLKEVTLRIFSVSIDQVTRQEAEDEVRNDVKDLSGKTWFDVRVERTGVSLIAYDNAFYGRFERDHYCG